MFIVAIGMMSISHVPKRRKDRVSIHGLIAPQIKKSLFEVLESEVVVREQEVGNTALEVAVGKGPVSIRRPELKGQPGGTHATAKYWSKPVASINFSTAASCSPSVA